MNSRSMFAGCVIAAVLAVTAGCGNPPQKAFDGKTLAVGQTLVEGYDPTADRPLSVYVPSGALMLRLQDQTSYLDDGSEYTFDDIEAADGAELIGIEWEMDDLSVYPGDVGEALMATYQTDLTEQVTSGGMGLVRLTVVADGHRIRLPSDEPTDKRSRAVVGVPAGSSPTLEVDYDGETQVVDLVTGDVEPGRADPLEALAGQPTKDSWQRGERVRCPAEGQPDLAEVGFTCGASPALELPYVRGLGWADEANPYVLLDLDLSVAGVSQSEAGVRRLVVTLDGDTAVRTIDYGWGDILVFSAKPNLHHQIRIKGRLAPSAGGAIVDKELDVETWRLR
ncbi:hypothetical protein ACIA03_03695 [Nocardioides sp. NPDC051685]|uniref:hypothetical protein n=1 Tax=Nocardioides sp. NPDC051685 TaxID=3364334 RepID=UPI0037893F92